MDFEHKISGYDFVRAMLLVGYRLVGTTMGRAVLVKDDRRLHVPQEPALPEDLVLDLLREGGVTPLQFITLLNRLGSRDTWPEQTEVVARDRHSRG
jgi:hypothetical protein